MTSPIHRCRLGVFADYFQFYVWDPAASKQQAPEDWTDEDIANRAKAVPGVFVICPVRNMTVPVEFEIWEREPEVIYAEWQHVVVAPLRTEGLIEIHECTGGSLATFKVEAGEYSIRALYRGLNTLSEDGLDGKDFYRVQMWRATAPQMFKVIKSWKE